MHIVIQGIAIIILLWKIKVKRLMNVDVRSIKTKRIKTWHKIQSPSFKAIGGNTS